MTWPGRRAFDYPSHAGCRTRTQRENEKIALERLRGFHEWLRGLQFLDPACGSGNFLYVTLDLVKQIEYEVLRGIEERLGRNPLPEIQGPNRPSGTWAMMRANPGPGRTKLGNERVPSSPAPHWGRERQTWL